MKPVVHSLNRSARIALTILGLARGADLSKHRGLWLWTWLAMPVTYVAWFVVLFVSAVFYVGATFS